MAQIKQSSAYNKMILLVGTSDHITGLAGATLTITASKAGGAFASISPTVTDRGSGWYNLALTTAMTDTLGDLALHITATSADPTDVLDQVIAQDLNSTAVAANVTQVGGANIATAASGYLPSDIRQWIGSAPNALIGGRVDSVEQFEAGTAQAGAAGSITLRSGASATDNLYTRQFVAIVSGTGAGQTRLVTGYTGASKVATVAPNWAINPDATSVYILVPNGYADVGYVVGTAQTARDLGAQLDATISSRMATFTLPTNFSTFSIDASGRVDVSRVAGTTQTARDLGAQLDATISSRQATLSLPVSANVTQWNSSALATPNSAGVPVVDDRSNAMRIATAQAVAAGTITLDASASATDNYYNDCMVVILSGTTGVGQARLITGYTGSTKVATVSPNWAVTPTGTIVFAVIALSRVDVGAVSGTTQTARDLGAQLDATISSRMATFTLPTNFGSLAITAGGAVTAGTVSDKTGYSLTQAFPANFSSLSIDVSGRVDVSRVLGTTQTARDLGGQLDAAISTRMATFALPTNFSSMVVSAAGRISSDVTFWNGAAVLSPNTAGVPIVDDRSSLLRSGTLQAAAGSTATLDAGASATDNFYNGQVIVAAGQARRVISYVGSTKVATLASAWIAAPGAVAYVLYSNPPTVDVGHVAGTAQTTRDLGAQLDATISSRMATFTLPTNFNLFSIDGSGRVDVSKVLGTTQTARDLGGQLDATISSRLAAASYTAPDNTSIAGIKTKTDFLPSATAGAAGGLLIAGANAATSFGSFTTNITGNLSGSVGSVTGAVGSVSGNVGGDVTGTVGSISDPSSIFNFVVENSRTFVQMLRGLFAVLLNKSAGMGTTTATFRDDADAKNRITATVDASGNRTAVTKDFT